MRTPRPAYLVLPRSPRRLILGAVTTIALAACIAVVISLALIRSSPRWWQTILREDPATKELARQVEHDLLQMVNEHRALPAAPGEPWKSQPWEITLDAAGANAWLNVRLPMWLANQKDEFHWPRNLSDLQVAFDDGEIIVGARVRSGDRYQVLTATLSPRIEKDGLWLPARWVNLGRLAVPASWVLERARSGAAEYVPPSLRNLEETQQLFRAFEGAEPIAPHTVFSVRGSYVRILSIKASAAHGGEVVVTCRTERAPDGIDPKAPRITRLGGE